MTTDKILEAIEALGDDSSLEHWRTVKNDRGGTNDYITDTKEYFGELCSPEDIPSLQALAAELKELREFVGAIDRVVIDGKTVWSDDGKWQFFENGEVVATGTDPFDAWRKIGESR